MDLQNVTTICKNLKQYPDLKAYLNKITKTCKIEAKSIHKSFSYPNTIIEKKMYSFYGVFMDYFIRRYLAEKLNIAFEDTRAEWYYNCLKSHYDNLDSEKIGNENKGMTSNEEGIEIIIDENEVECFQKNNQIVILHSEEIGDGRVKLGYIKIRGPVASRIMKAEEIMPGYKESYEKVVDVKTHKTMDVVKDISNVSNAHLVWFGQKIIEDPLDYDQENLQCIMNYLDSLIIGKDEILLNPALGGKYFKGDCDLIFDDVIIDIKTSKNDKKYVSDFYQLIMYSYGAFDNLKKNIRTFNIYNPLLGKEYKMVLNDVNYDEFGHALKCCIILESE